MENYNEIKQTHKQDEFLDFMQHGDDFFKIELYRPARAWYMRALELNIERERVRKKIADCNRLIAHEVKIIWILVAIALFFVLLSVILS
jgi:hypothetical protein